MIGICSTGEVKHTHLAEVGVLQCWVCLLSVCLHGVLQDENDEMIKMES